MKSNGGNGLMMGAQQAPRQQVKLEDLPEVECNCGGKLFATAMGIRYANPLVSQNGQPTMVQVPSGWICANCGKPNDFKWKPELSDILPKPEEEVEISQDYLDALKRDEEDMKAEAADLDEGLREMELDAPDAMDTVLKKIDDEIEY